MRRLQPLHRRKQLLAPSAKRLRGECHLSGSGCDVFGEASPRWRLWYKHPATLPSNRGRTTLLDGWPDPASRLPSLLPQTMLQIQDWRSSEERDARNAGIGKTVSSAQVCPVILFLLFLKEHVWMNQLSWIYPADVIVTFEWTPSGNLLFSPKLMPLLFHT